jgi:outer membrane protein TolC
MKSLRLSLVGLAALLLTSCMVGPNYSRPSVPMPVAYKEGLRPAPTQSRQSPPAREGWKTAQPSDQTPRGHWWEIFGDPQLNAPEEQVTLANQDLKAAEVRFRQARVMIGYARASEFPTISTGAASVPYASPPIDRSRLRIAAAGTLSSPSTSPTSWTSGVASGGR